LKYDPSGFDYWIMLPGQGVYHNPVMIEMGQKKQLQGYATDLIADYSLDYLKRRDKSKPFFLMCHHKAPHRPWQPDAKHANMYEGENVPEPFNLFDHYEHRSKAAANATNKVGENMVKSDVKRDIRPISKATRYASGRISITSRITCATSRRWTTMSDACWITSTPKA